MESKNMHVIPTDKPSRLVRNGKKLLLVDIPKNYTLFGITVSVNIYITSDEEIGTDEYYFHLKNNEYYNSGRIDEIDKDMKFWRKIILTTDQDLIKENVQAIDDEFLELFVKNPSCEEVKVDWVDFSGSYFINIPKQSTKDRILSETPELVKQKVREKANDLLGNSKQDWFCPKCNSYVSAESVTFEENHQICNTGVIVKEDPKQETLEESAENWLDKYSDKFEIIKSKFLPFHFNNRNELKELINEVAKGQQEIMYSEEEVLELLLNRPEPYLSDEEIKKWFEQFKKK